MDSSPIQGLILFSAFILLNFITYCFGEASQNINEAELNNKVQDGDRRAKKLSRIVENPRNFVVTIQFMATTFAVISGAYNLVIFNKYRVPIQILAFVAHIVILVCVGIIIPQRIGNRKPDKWALGLVNIINVIMIVCKPFTFIIVLISSVLLKLMGIDYKEEHDSVTEEEIISIVNEGHEQGVLEEQEAEMISNIMEMDEKDAENIMTHRKNVIAIDGDWTLADTVEFIINENNSRFPVYEGNIDNIVGIMHFRDAFTTYNKIEDKNIKVKELPNILREPVFIPETKNIDSLFDEMQKAKNHMCIVIDEYGQMAGIVTMEDILEEIVGNIMDEYDEEDDSILKESEDTYLIKGMTSLAAIEDAVGISFEGEEFETLNGYLISKLERIPDEEEDEEIIIDTDKGQFQVLSVEGNMIAEVRLELLKEETDEVEEDKT
ncbi:MAG: HlyC/CorC family transporter [Lachnospiraceae bacterium]|nr:HlyC/CorC family transporter [Lachnospiraceae bacterium]